jgi:glycosyltransferase involved in cell wall biosynthesis
MKVLFIVTAYPRHDGDVITPWMGETIERLIAAGTQVEVLAPAYKGSRSGKIGGVMVHRFRYAPAPLETLTHDMPAVERIRRSPAFLSLVPSYVAAGSRAAARITRKGNFDVVHAFWPIPHGLFAVAARKRSRAAMVSTFFSAELTWDGITRRAFAPIIRRIVRASDAVTVISSYTAQRLHEYERDADTVTIPFGAAAVEREQTSETALRNRRKEDPFVLLFLGRLVRRKGVNVLLDAAKLLLDDPRLSIRIVGGGPEQRSLEAQARQLGLGPMVTFEGVVPSEVVQDRLALCDALVLPAIVTETGDTEGLGVVLIEAMGYSKPVIASAAGGIVDVVTDGETGLLVPPGDAVALARAIRRAMDEPEELRRMAARGNEFAASAFGWDEIVSRLSSVYHSAVAARRGT